MRLIICCLLTIVLFGACKKDRKDGPKVEIYALESYTIHRDPGFTTLTPYTPYITNAVLKSKPFVRDEDIKYYKQSESMFKLKRSIKDDLKDFNHTTGFAVTVDNVPIYYGLFHPAYLSSITFGLATIDPILFVNENELRIGYIGMTSDPELVELDKRNEKKLINALSISGRLR